MGAGNGQRNLVSTFIRDLVYRGMESFGRYYSSYRGYVYKVDDPLHQNRLQLIIPQVTGNTPFEEWAFPKHNFAGDGYGSQCLPKVGEVVWVEFEGGDPSIPIWQHGYFGLNEKPKDADLQDVNNYWFLTPNGNLVILNDTKNSIKVRTKAGDLIEINTKGILVEAVDDKKICLKNNKTSLKTLFKDLSLMYMTTKTIDGMMLDAESIKKANNLLREVNKLLY